MQVSTSPLRPCCLASATARRAAAPRSRACGTPAMLTPNHLPRALLVVQGGVLVHHIRQVRLVRDKAVHKGKQFIPSYSSQK